MTITPINNPEYTSRIVAQYPYDLANEQITDGPYTVKGNYIGEIRFGPAYISAVVYQNDTKIWDSNTYGGELFCHNILSAPHHKLILVKWFSFRDPNQQVVVEVDLLTKKERELTPRARYFYAGHMYSCNMIFYSETAKDIICKDLDTGQTFNLTQQLALDIQNVRSWGLSPVPNTILVLSPKGNLYLYDIKHKRIVESTTFDITPFNNCTTHFFLDKQGGKTLVRFWEGTQHGRGETYMLVEF